MPTLILLIACLLMKPPIKHEVETSINKSDMPSAALMFLDSTLAKANDIRYYKETDGQHVTFEVKFRLDGQEWSVEFDPSGTLEDAEWLVNMKDLSPEWRTRIRSHLDSRFTSWTATRVQLQYLTWPADLDHPTGVELIVEGQNSSEIGVFEFGFPSDDSAVSERRVLEILEF